MSMDFSKITKDEEVIALLKEREELEAKIHSLDDEALIKYEMYMLQK